MGGAARFWMVVAALAGLTAVLMAAQAAHALPKRLEPRAVEAVRAGVQMQGWHALALFGTALWLGRGGPGLLNGAGAAFTLGMILFCGSVYAGEIAGIRIGPTAPIGGVALMLGWALLGVSALIAR